MHRGDRRPRCRTLSQQFAIHCYILVVAALGVERVTDRVGRAASLAGKVAHGAPRNCRLNTSQFSGIWSAGKEVKYE